MCFSNKLPRDIDTASCGNTLITTNLESHAYPQCLIAQHGALHILNFTSSIQFRNLIMFFLVYVFLSTQILLPGVPIPCAQRLITNCSPFCAPFSLPVSLSCCAVTAVLFTLCAEVLEGQLTLIFVYSVPSRKPDTWQEGHSNDFFQ